jgi:hypothetical protein
MRPFVRITHMAPEQVRIQLRGGDVRVTEQLLHHTQIRTAIEEVCCE